MQEAALAPALAFVLFLGGCADGVPSTPLSEQEWHPRPWPVSSPGILCTGPAAPREFDPGLLVLPEAHETWDDGFLRERASQRNGPTFVLNVLARGEVQFRGERYALSGPEPNRSAVLARLRTEVRDLAVGFPHGVHVLFHADRGVPWQDMRAVLAVVAESPSVREVAIAVEEWGRRDDRCLRFRLEREPHPFVEPVEDVALRHDPVDTPAVRLTLGRSSWVFPPEDRFDDAAFLTEANRVWDEVRRSWPGLLGGRDAVALTLDPGGGNVPWAYVVSTLEVLPSVGVSTVVLPDVGLRLSPLQPPPGPRDEHWLTAPSPGPLVIALCVLAAALAFVLTLGPLRRGRLRRRG